METEFEKKTIECLCAPALRSAVRAGWYNYVEEELERNRSFAMAHCDTKERVIYEAAELWLVSAAGRSEEDKRSLLNHEHPVIKDRPQFFEAYRLLERMPGKVVNEAVLV
ncbi:hypothetical protein HFO09_29235 [Rhizobium laguerreae]|uniref:hypothetical protein n=1 Tax=Rhizobium laguerreae TaxID=1076926 RepID=UPI001C91DD01|nr:hypothetical protein [Rhizobium laguerreae]MBY3258453.1 hypothetical protein [Rhizobium laguerreae]MBY3286440.1 hypothetical protein [Rhizobium laguerreae]MBY3293103.1 hypothetical protein [Rhizobium laguerreae]